MICPICDNKMTKKYVSWHCFCENCGYEASKLLASINQKNNKESINESFRSLGLESLRKSNFVRLLRKISKYKPTGRLLDVGCAHGWFLAEAGKHFSVLGIEPDIEISNQTLLKGLDVRQGYFPDVLQSDDLFDVIVFNDVFEHLTDVNLVLDSVKDHLSKDAILVINLPNSSGFFYFLSKLLCGLGVKSFFERLWQKDMPSPHLHYFNKNNLRVLLRKHGFRVLNSGALPAVTFNGMYYRIKYSQNFNTLTAAMINILMLILIPIHFILPSDITYVIASKDAENFR